LRRRVESGLLSRDHAFLQSEDGMNVVVECLSPEAASRECRMGLALKGEL